MSLTQRRGRRIAMNEAELNAFLEQGRTCRVASTGARGPHLTPLWYVWDGTALWLTSLVDSKRWTDLQQDPRVAVLVDAGEEYAELRGVELRGTVEVLGEVPRTGAPHPELAELERLFARKYGGGGAMRHDGRHGWLRLVPDAVTSWDFRKAQTEPTAAARPSASLDLSPYTIEASPDGDRLSSPVEPQRTAIDPQPSILGLLDLERLENNLFRFRTLFDDPNRLFGGQVAAQALFAAGQTVPDDRVPHSLHGYFLREGTTLRPTVFQVERDRDGRSFSARRVVAIQNGEVIFNMAASFAVRRPETAPEPDAGPRPELPRPDTLPAWVYRRHMSFELRSGSEDAWPGQFWVRCTAGLPDDPLLHAAALTYASDMSSGLFSLRGKDGPGGGGASLDHAVWFHRPVRMNDWVWHQLTPQTAGSGRGLYIGAVYDAAGARVATIGQEALFRARRGAEG